jgi:glycosyltransferase involved in cell wall biosynthesis
MVARQIALSMMKDPDGMTQTASPQIAPDKAPPRVLYLTKVYPYPPATAGDAVYSRGIIEALAPHCALSVLCADSGAPFRPDPRIDWHCVGPQRGGRAGSVLSRWPLIAWKGATRDYRRALRQLLRRDWDAIVLDNLGLAHALPLAEAYRRAHPATRLVYVSHEYEYPTRAGKYGSYRLGGLKGRMAARDLRKVKASEEALLRRCDIVSVINTADLVPFRKIAPGRKYLPFSPGYDGPVTASRQITADSPRRVLLLGGRKSEQKRQILLDWLALSHARLERAGIETVIAGDMDDSLSQQIGALYPTARRLGFVEDIGALIDTARMGLIADTVGGGFKMRLLSHVFGRLPIVGLAEAIDGLPTAEGAGYLGAPDLAALVDLVLEVIDDPARLNALHERAFADCIAEYSWPARAAAFVQALRDPESEVLV